MSYGYYKTSSRGRGFSSRGSYRGRGGDSSFYGRGSYRGRSTWQTDRSTGFDSRSRYTSATSSRSQIDESGYRRYAREDEMDYSSHDRSYHRSPDSSRKRMRPDHGYSQASSARRTHEGYEGGADYSNRYSYAEDKEGYGYREDRRSTGGFRDRSRDEYSHRKQEPLEVSMPPPSSRYVSSVRSSYRGRIRTRGFRGISKISLARRTSSFLSRKRSMVDPNAVRKRIVSTRTQADTLRRLRILKLRRLREANLLRRAELAGKKEKEDSSKATEDISDDEDDNEEENDQGETEGNEEVKVVKKKKKVKKEGVKKEKEESKDGDEKEDEEEMEDEDEGEDEEDDDEDEDEKAKDAGSNDEAKAEEEESRNRSSLFRGRPFIKLNCPHCYTRCITFQEYNAHLYSFKHINAVRKLWRLHKTVLTQLRMRQRQKQRIIDKKKEEGEEVPLKTKYCIVCKLNYADLKTEHVASEYHKKIIDFMKPYCKICQFRLNSPMLYEKHVCSLDHIKRKALLASEKDLKKDSGSGGEEEEKELDLENFMTLDSVGTFDDMGEEGKKEGDDKVKKEKEEKKPKSEVTLGGEHIKKVKVQYCELCRMYLSRSDQSDKALSAHCRSRTHLTFYMRYRRRLERKEAEERRMKLLAKKKAKNEMAKKAAQEQEGNEKMDVDKDTATKPADSLEDISNSPSKEKSDSTRSKAGDASSDAAGESHEADQDLETDEKMWADVDKDLGDILREVEPDNKSSDEDDDGTEGGRYDRFKYSEKGIAEDGKVAKEGEDQAAEMEVEEDSTTKASNEQKSGTPSPVKKIASTPAAITPATVAAAK